MADKASSGTAKEALSSKTVLELLEEDDEFEVWRTDVLLHHDLSLPSIMMRFWREEIIPSTTKN